mmetsp:Transcript_77462/g.214636  ORF Transcript_77462/g.214636 Transcript_77462/m.214636 type:complete len:268 (+) Transcript_77462:962-1765(+)
MLTRLGVAVAAGVRRGARIDAARGTESRFALDMRKLRRLARTGARALALQLCCLQDRHAPPHQALESTRGLLDGGHALPSDTQLRHARPVAACEARRARGARADGAACAMNGARGRGALAVPVHARRRAARNARRRGAGRHYRRRSSVCARGRPQGGGRRRPRRQRMRRHTRIHGAHRHARDRLGLPGPGLGLSAARRQHRRSSAVIQRRSFELWRRGPNAVLVRAWDLKAPCLRWRRWRHDRVRRPGHLKVLAALLAFLAAKDALL